MSTTSVIHEFSILYSDRLVQKDKKWADGVLKYYEFNNKIEILNEDGVLIKADFKKINFEINKQYQINKLLVEILDFVSTTERDILMIFKKEASQDSTMPNSPTVNKRPNAIVSKPSIKPLTPKKNGPDSSVSSPVPSKKPRLVGTKAANVRAGLSRPSGIKPTANKAVTLNSSANPQRSKTLKVGLKFKVVTPIIRRIPPYSTKIYRFIE